jgi:hypothetical protein
MTAPRRTNLRPRSHAGRGCCFPGECDGAGRLPSIEISRVASRSVTPAVEERVPASSQRSSGRPNSTDKRCSFTCPSPCNRSAYRPSSQSRSFCVSDFYCRLDSSTSSVRPTIRVTCRGRSKSMASRRAASATLPPAGPRRPDVCRSQGCHPLGHNRPSWHPCCTDLGQSGVGGIPLRFQLGHSSSVVHRNLPLKLCDLGMKIRCLFPLLRRKLDIESTTTSWRHS